MFSLKRHLLHTYKTSDFINDAKSASIDEILIQLQIKHTGSGCCSGTDNVLILSDPKKRIESHEAIEIPVRGVGYTAKEYCAITRAAEQLKHELKGFKVVYDSVLTDFVKRCDNYRK